jgi:hypothetical protein
MPLTSNNVLQVAAWFVLRERRDADHTLPR